MERMGDAKQKEYLAQSLAPDITDDDDEYEEDEDDFSNVQVIDWDLVETVLGDDTDEFIGAIRSGEVPQGFVGHHGEMDENGEYQYQLITTFRIFRRQIIEYPWKYLILPRQN